MAQLLPPGQVVSVTAGGLTSGQPHSHTERFEVAHRLLLQLPLKVTVTCHPQERLGSRYTVCLALPLPPHAHRSPRPLATAQLENSHSQSPVEGATCSALAPWLPAQLSDTLKVGSQKGRVPTCQLLAPSFREPEIQANRGGICLGEKPPPPEAWRPSVTWSLSLPRPGPPVHRLSFFLLLPLWTLLG